MFLTAIYLCFCLAQSVPTFQDPFVPEQLNEKEISRNHSLLGRVLNLDKS